MILVLKPGETPVTRLHAKYYCTTSAVLSTGFTFYIQFITNKFTCGISSFFNLKNTVLKLQTIKHTICMIHSILP